MLNSNLLFIIYKFFSHSVNCLFILSVVSFALQKLLSLIRSHLFLFLFPLRDGSKEILLQFMLKSVLPMFLSKNFIVSCLTFRSLIHFEFIFIYGISEVKVIQLCPTLWPHGLHSPWNSVGQNTGVGCLSLLQGIFPTQGSNLCLPHCRQILYRLSHQESPHTGNVIHAVVSSSLQPLALQHARPLCPSPSPEVCPSSCPLHWWCTI